MSRDKERRQERKEQGLCVGCGKCESRPHYLACEQCSKKANQRVKRYKAKQCALGNCECGKSKIPGKSLCQKCLKTNNKRSAIYGRKDRLLCVEAYGAKCECCGIDVEKYLQLDHIDGGGDEHRRSIFGRKQGPMAKWARQNNFPKILQLLCANCHQAKTRNDPCTDADHIVMRKCQQSKSLAAERINN